MADIANQSSDTFPQVLNEAPDIFMQYESCHRQSTGLIPGTEIAFPFLLFEDTQLCVLNT
jgi:hypothetical protein